MTLGENVSSLSNNLPLLQIKGPFCLARHNVTQLKGYIPCLPCKGVAIWLNSGQWSIIRSFLKKDSCVLIPHILQSAAWNVMAEVWTILYHEDKNHTAGIIEWENRRCQLPDDYGATTSALDSLPPVFVFVFLVREKWTFILFTLYF